MEARIFLADDERPVLEGVAAAIRKRLPDVVICGTAGTGRDAVDGAIRERPDVILMDVRMPGMSGLEALRELRSSAPETVPILLTAYERFDVAKEAFGLGVYDYLVKPVDQNLLVEAIRGALGAAASRKAEAARARNAIEALEARRPLLEEGLVYAALSGDDDGSRVAAYAAALGFGAAGGGFVAFGKPARGQGASDGRSDPGPVASNNPSPCTSADEEGIRALLGYHMGCAVGAPFCGIVPVFYPADEAAAVEHAVRTVLVEQEHSRMAAGIGRQAPADRLVESWQAALAALDGLTPGQAVSSPPAESTERRARQSGPVASSGDTALERALEAAAIGDPGAALTAWADLPDDRIIKAAVAGAVAWSLRRDPAAVLEAATAVSSGVVPRAAFNSGKPGAGYGAAGRTMEALRYVAERYADPLSLEDVAARVGLSAAHLSRVLSSETGKSFIEHLSDIRIARAKAELASGRMSVKEVGAAVGYADPNYFSRAFKRVTGMTPSDYARLSGREVR